MEKPPINNKVTAIVITLIVALSHVGAIFSDGLTIAKTQQQLLEEIAKQPEQYLELASHPLYRSLFLSYTREIGFLKKIARARKQEGKEELSSLITRTKLNLNPMFRTVLKAESRKDQKNAERQLFIQLARPTVDEKTASVYQHGRKLMSSLGIELPELRSS